MTVAVVAVAAALVGTVHAPVARAEPECLWSSYDFNRDGAVDLAAGLPGADDDTGAVEVRLSDEDGGYRTVRVRPDGLRAGDRFGAAVAQFASYEDEGQDARCSILAVGAPGRDVAGRADAGAVFVFTFVDGRFQRGDELVQGSDGVPGTPSAGARFGAALASTYHQDDIAPIVTPLYVGAPGTRVHGFAGAGRAYRLRFGGAGGGITDSATIGQGAGVPGTPEAGDAFGTSLAATGLGVVVGVPGENGGAGAVAFRLDDPAADGRTVTQNSAGVPGAGEPGDRFGQAVAYAPFVFEDGLPPYVLVGAPGEAVGSLRGAGAVTLFPGSTLETGEVRAYSQDSPHVRGHAEAGDAFGAAVSGLGGRLLVAGAPGEDVGSVRDAGAVTTFGPNDSYSDPAWDQDTTGVAGTAEAGDRFGAVLAEPGLGVDPSADRVGLLVGVPGENGGAGFVQYGRGPGEAIGTRTWTAASAAAGDGFGSALGRIG